MVGEMRELKAIVKGRLFDLGKKPIFFRDKVTRKQRNGDILDREAAFPVGQFASIIRT